MREIASPLSGPFTTFGQTPIDIYKVGAYRPELAYSFYNEYYRRGRQPVNFLDAITHTRNGNATMTDSSGNIVWAPHNLLTYSEDFSNAAWVKTDTTVTANAATAPDGTITADKISHDDTTAEISQNVTSVNGALYEGALFFKYIDHQWVTIQLDGNKCWVDIQNGVIGTDNITGTEITALSDSWYMVSAPRTSVGTTFTFTVTLASGDNSSTESSGTSAYIWGAHLYRNDLGGMADVPASERVLPTATKYVSTTDAARYLPRRGHHVYNGSQWVNKGLLVESEARTNLRTYSTPASSNITILNGTLTDDQAVNVAGNLAAPELVEDTTASLYHQLVLISTAGESSDDVVTFSCFVKRGVGSRNFGIRLRDSDGASIGNNCIARFDLDTGAVYSTVENGTGNYIDSGISDYGNGWFRCHLTGSISSLVNNYLWNLWIVDENGTEKYTGDGVSSLYIDGLQQEAASTPSSYIPTSGSTVTRAAETLTIPAANLPWPNPVYVTGEELVTNGTFDTDTSGWSVDSGCTLTYVSGTCQVDTTADTTFAITQSCLTVGQPVEVSFDITTDATAIIRVREGANIMYTSGSVAAGTYNVRFVNIPKSSTTIEIGVNGGSVSQFVIDNISVKEINPLSVSIQMSGEMTYADTAQYDEVRMARWHNTSANDRIDLKIDTFGTRTGTFYAFTTIGGSNFSETTIAVGEYSPDVNVPFNIAGVFTSTEIAGAKDGLTDGTRSSSGGRLPDLENTDLKLANLFMGTISLFRIWANDLGDTGIEEATEPSTQATLFLSFDGSNNSYVDFEWNT